MRTDIFHPDFKALPWWWEAWKPDNALSQDPPGRTDVVIVGAGYGGLSTALELCRNGARAVVLERGDFGIGASTRNGGMVSGGTNLGKRPGRRIAKRFAAMALAASLRESLWGRIQETQGRVAFDYAGYAAENEAKFARAYDTYRKGTHP